MDNNKKQENLLLAGLAAAAVVTGVLAVMNNNAGRAANPNPVVSEPSTTTTTVAAEAIPVLVAEQGTGITVTKSSDWEEQYPNEYYSYALNDENSEHHSYIEQHPYIETLYSGYGFAIQYESARGHTYVVEDVTSTGRPHKLANCFTCKTSDFTAKALNDSSAYSMAFEDMEAEITDAFGCFHCHQNEPGTLYVTHTYLADALGDDLESQNMQNLSCAQCHSEYYFDPATKATTLGYVGHDNATPEKILDYYNNLKDAEGNAFADWTDETTGVRKLKVQHPEFETYTAAGGIHPDMTCVTCHMGTATADDGTTYTNHYWSSPLDNPELLESSCNVCHGDITSQVEAIQEETAARRDEIGEGLALANEALAEAVADGSLGEEDLAKARELARSAQWYWDFVFVENSKGVHNKTLAADCLDKAEQYLTELNEVLGA